jgi:outer membrane protein OmpU
MHRHLLAGTSAIALLMGASVANAQFTVAIGGDLTVDFGYTELDTPETAAGVDAVEDPRSTDFIQRTRLTFTATQKADSGLTYGAQTRVRFGANRAGVNNGVTAGTASDIDADRAFIFVNGGFGQVVIGQNYGHYENSNLRADAWGTGGADGVFPNFVGGQNRGAMFPVGTTSFGTLPVSDTSSSRIFYVTPTFSGFRASVGYAPTIGAGDKGRAAQLDENAATFNDVIEISANYGAAFDSVRVDLNLGYVFGGGRPGADAATNLGGTVAGTEDLSAYAASLRLAFGPAAVSLHYVNAGESGQVKGDTTKDDAVSYMIYAQYTVLPELTIGANYGVYKGPGATGVGAGAGLAGDHELTAWAIGAAYTLAPGLTLRPEYVNYDFENSEAGGRDYDGNLFILRTQVTF